MALATAETKTRVPQPRRPDPTPEQRAEWTERYNGGETMQSVASSIGCSENWLKAWFRRWGVHVRGREEAQRLSWSQRHPEASSL